MASLSAVSRISALLDEGSFVELGAYIRARNTDFNLSVTDTPADGVITGYGTIGSALVYVYSQDASVLGGSMGEMHAKKITAVYEQAIKMGAPIIGLIDCAGLRLQEASDALDAFGKLYMAQSMASGVVPQIQAVFGYCGGGMAISAALSDFTFMEEKNAKLFINSPNVIRDNYEAKLDTASAEYQSKKTGLADFVGSEAEILSGIRELIAILPANSEDNLSYIECEDDLNRLIEENANLGEFADILLQNISDSGYYLEVKKDYAREMVTAFIRLNGNTIGCVANRAKIYDADGQVEELGTVLTEGGVNKAAEFVNFCDNFGIPVLTVTNVDGYHACKCTEKRMARAMAGLTSAFALASIPKVNIIVGKAYGSAYLSMNSKSIGADIVYAWENASIGMMDPKKAVEIMYAKEIETAEDATAMIEEKTREYKDLQSGVVSAASRGYVDDIIKVAETRKRLIASFEMLFTKRDFRF